MTDAVRPVLVRAAPALAALASVALGIGLTEPVMALYALDLGATPLQAATVVAVRWITRLFTNVPAGAWSDRRGRRTVTLTGTAAIAAAAIVAVIASDWRVLLVSRVLEGLGAGALMTSILATFADLTEDERTTRARLFGWYQMIHRLGFWLGPALGAALYAVAGGRAVMLGFAGLALLALVVSLRIRETRHPSVPAVGEPPAERVRTRAAVGLLLRKPAFLWAGAVAFASFFTLTGAQFTAMPVFVVEVRDMGAGALGLSMLVINAVGFALIYPSARLADRRGRRLPIAGLSVMGAAGLLVLASTQGPAGLMVASVLLGGATALRGPALQAFAMDAGAAVSTGVSAGVFRALGDLGSAAGPMVAGLTVALGHEAFFLINAAILGLGALAFVLSRDVREQERQFGLTR